VVARRPLSANILTGRSRSQAGLDGSLARYRRCPEVVRAGFEWLRTQR